MAAAPGFMERMLAGLQQNAPAIQQMGNNLQQGAANQQQDLVSQLAKMGPPPAITVPQAAPQQNVGMDLMGKIKQMMGPTTPPVMTRGESMTNGSQKGIGSLLAGGY